MARATKHRARASRAVGRPGSRQSARRIPLLWLVVGSVLVLAIIAFAVYRSLGGDSANSGAVGVLKAADYHALAFSPDDPNLLLFGNHNGVMRSEDGGRTWRPLMERRNFDGMNLAFSRNDGKQVYLAGHGVFQVSNDGGASWRPVSHNLPGTDIHAFAMSPDDPKRLYALVTGRGIFRSEDGGQAWQKLDGRLPQDVMALAVAGGGTETLYAGSMASGVLKSVDGGQTWQPVVSGLGSRSVMALAVDPFTPETVYAGLDSGLYKSVNGGSGWSKLSLPATNVAALTVSPAQAGVISAIAVKDQQGLVYRSEDGGQTWGGSN